MAKVYQVINPVFNEDVQRWPQGYELVAAVDTDSVDVAFQQTNTIMHPWWENRDVAAFKRARSTSVGDIVEVNGKFWMVCMTGWKEVQVNPSPSCTKG
jgi:hypothetical protein